VTSPYMNTMDLVFLITRARASTSVPGRTRRRTAYREDGEARPAAGRFPGHRSNCVIDERDQHAAVHDAGGLVWRSARGRHSPAVRPRRAHSGPASPMKPATVRRASRPGVIRRLDPAAGRCLVALAHVVSRRSLAEMRPAQAPLYWYNVTCL
jgi:hypothetical protein